MKNCEASCDKTNLIRALKTNMAPILYKSDHRDQYHKIVKSYLKNMDSCLSIHEGHLVIKKKDKILVTFEKKLGSVSENGIAYMNLGKGFGKLLKFSCKLMPANVKNNAIEIAILAKTSKLVEQNKFPNMPMLYMAKKCSMPCEFKECPDLIQYNTYFIVLNELADYDLNNWFKESHSIKDYQSIILQLFLAILKFHKLGYIHDDLHLGNVLIHKITSGGVWHYKIGSEDIYVENTGYLLVLWDFGDVISINDNNQISDYYRPFNIMYDQKLLPDKLRLIIKPLLFNLEKKMKLSIKDEEQLIIKIIKGTPFNISDKKGILNITSYIV